MISAKKEVVIVFKNYIEFINYIFEIMNGSLKKLWEQLVEVKKQIRILWWQTTAKRLINVFKRNTELAQLLINNKRAIPIHNLQKDQYGFFYRSDVYLQDRIYRNYNKNDAVINQIKVILPFIEQMWIYNHSNWFNEHTQELDWVQYHKELNMNWWTKEEMVQFEKHIDRIIDSLKDSGMTEEDAIFFFILKIGMGLYGGLNEKRWNL